MSKKIQLTIAEPCHENWDGMTPVEKGKFCGSCQKQVVDFSDMSDRQVAEFFKKPILSLSKGGSVCGRFMTDQLDRPIEIPKKRIPWVKYFFQIALPAFLVSIKASAQKAQGQVNVKSVAADTTRRPVINDYKMMGMVARPQNLKPFMGDTIVMQVNEPVEKIKGELKTITDSVIVEPVCSRKKMGKIAMPVPVNKNEIEGIVVDGNNQPVPYASIETGKPGEGIMADGNGYFKIKKSWLSNGKTLVFSSTGFESNNVIAGTETYTAGKLVVQMKSNVILSEVVVIAYGSIRCSRTVTGAVSYVKGETISVANNKDSVVSKSIKLPAEENKLFVYPNPVQSGATINLSFKKLEEGYYQLKILNYSAQIVEQKEIWIDTEARLMNLEVPSVAAGTYFLVLTNKKSGKKFTEKIIIQ